MLFEKVPWTYWLVALLLFVVASIVQNYKPQDPALPKVRIEHEPPCIGSAVPLIGHVLNYIDKGPEYLYRLWKQTQHSIYTLKIFNKSVYIFADPEALQIIEKHRKTIINDELFVEGTTKLFLWSKRQHDISLIHLHEPDSTMPSLLKTVRPALRDSLRHGPGLDEIGVRYQKELGLRFNEVAARGPQKILLWDWLRQTMTLSAGLATFGHQHPFVQDPALQADFWAVEKDNLKLILYPFPSLLQKKAFKARKRVLTAMTEYAAGNGISEASEFVKAYHQVLAKYGLTNEEVGTFDATVLTAFIGSLIPLGFWTICYILAKPDLTTAIREEVHRCIVSSGSSERGRSIDMDKLRSDCPLLRAALREASRLAMQAPLFRTVTRDTHVSIPSTGETYMLKKGSMALIAVSAVHANEDAWGEDVLEFNEGRFLSQADSDCEKGKLDTDIARPVYLDGSKRSAFTPFASSVHLCPGRHYAQTVIMTTAALFFTTFDVVPIHGNKITVPPMKPELGLGAGKPTQEVEVMLQKRKAFEGLEWDSRS